MSHRRFRLLAVLGGTALLAACAPMNIEDYAGRGPQLDIRQFMNGQFVSKGTFISLSGDADPIFKDVQQGYWNGDEGQLNEHLIYNDGHTQDRVWHLHMVDDHCFTGTATDVIGKIEGRQYGNAIEATYTIRITTKDGDTHDLRMDDWFYRIDNNEVLERNEVSKFGFTVGEIVSSTDKK